MADLTIKPWQVTLTIQDGEGQTSKHSVYYGAVTWAALRQWLTDYIDAVEAVIDGSVTDVEVSRELVVNDPKPVADDADKEHIVTTPMLGEDQKQRGYLAIPAVDEGFMTKDTYQRNKHIYARRFDTTHNEVEALRQALSLVNGNLVSERGETIGTDGNFWQGWR